MKPLDVMRMILGSDMSAIQKALSIALVLHADNSTGECFPSQKTLALDTGFGVTSVKKGIAELRDLGAKPFVEGNIAGRFHGCPIVLTVENQTYDGRLGYRSNLYQLTPRLPSPADQPHGDQPQPHGDQPQPHGDQPQPHGDQPQSHGDQPQPHGDQPQAGDAQPQAGDAQPQAGDDGGLVATRPLSASGSAKRTANVTAESESRTDVESVFAHYIAGWKSNINGKRTPRLDDKRRVLIQERIDEGHSVDDLKQACDGLWQSEWHRREKYWTIEAVCKSTSTVEKLMAETEEDLPWEWNPKSFENPTEQNTGVPAPQELIDALHELAQSKNIANKRKSKDDGEPDAS